MLKFVMALLLTLPVKGILKAQNLVPNPGFEIIKKSLPACDVTLPRDTFSAYIQDWFYATDATPDVFSTLVDASCIASPFTTHPPLDDFPVARRVPRPGSNNFGGFTTNPYYREYLEVKLKAPLIPGEVYCCEMYVSRSAAALYASNCIGMYFSDGKIDEISTVNLEYPAQVQSEGIVEDTVEWVKIKGAFLAASSAQYLTIGNFCNVSKVSMKQYGSADGTKYPGSYYYIDDISVERAVPPKPVITGKTSICPGEKLDITASGREGYIWIDPKGKYVSKIANLKTTPAPGTSYYLLQGTYCGYDHFIDTVFIQFNPEPGINLGKDTLICPGTSLTLSAGSGLQNIQWQDGSSGSTYMASQPAIYSVKASNSFGCNGQDQIAIGFYEPPKFSLGEDLEQCHPTGTLDASTGHDYDRYVWQDGSQAAAFNYPAEGRYWVTAENPCQIKLSDTITIAKINMFIPNLITPNGDNHNEVFEVLGARAGKGSMKIFNRHGALVFEGKGYQHNWNAAGLTSGVYYYVYSYPTCDDMKGWIEVVK